MRCDEFDQLCQMQLDARSTADPERDCELDRHAADCPVCRPLYLRYFVLRQVVSAATPPVPALGFVERCLAAYDNEPAVVPFPARFRALAPWAAVAAAAFFAAALFLRGGPRQPITGRLAPAPAIVQKTSVEALRPLSESLADATSATLALARETSAPAARIGRHVLSATNLPATDWTVALPASDTGDMIQSVGSQVEAGVRPFSGTARSAFGFLLPAVTPASAPAKRPAQGA
jgi:hypothetical protein